MSKLQFSEQAWQDYLYWLSVDKKIAKRINSLLKDIDQNGHEGIGKPEALKGNLSGFWSRRIDEKNRIVYRVEKDIIEIASLKGHYGDK